MYGYENIKETILCYANIFLTDPNRAKKKCF